MELIELFVFTITVLSNGVYSHWAAQLTKTFSLHSQMLDYA